MSDYDVALDAAGLGAWEHLDLDDAFIVAFVLRTVLRRSGHGPIVEHGPGPQQSRELMLRIASRAGHGGSTRTC